VYSSTAPPSGVMSAALGGCTFTVTYLDLPGWQLAPSVQLPLTVTQLWQRCYVIQHSMRQFMLDVGCWQSVV
jgi:hypothetical protein